MTGQPVRKAGRRTESDASITTWTVAEGRRGRRWRWVSMAPDGAVQVAHTVETDPAGRFVRLESAAAGGRLLSLHREADGSFHGNHVGRDGVAAIAVTKDPPQVVLVGASDLAAAIAIATFGPFAETIRTSALVIADDLTIATAPLTARPLVDGTVEIIVGGVAARRRLTPDGLPDVAAGDLDWALDG